MLTRLEVHGFKNLLDFAVDLAPFNCIAGANGVGKSNLFDAILFLSYLADLPIVEAALSLRGTDPETGDLRDLFWTDGKEYVDHLRLGAEMIVEPQCVDDFGRQARATSTYLRYEVEIGYEPPTSSGHLGRLALRSEELHYITESDAVHRLHFPHSAKRFRQGVVYNRRRSRSGYIATHEAEDGKTEIHISQDGGGRGPAQKAYALTAPRTIVATSNTSATPTILAARREMQSWRLLALEPSAMRGADPFHAEPHVTSSGAHLPATLHRLATEASRDEDEGSAERLLARIANRLADLVPVQELTVGIDEVRKLLTLLIREEGGVLLPARALSDGTLRFLALCILQEDPAFRGLVCIEEPENGIHPAKMEAMVQLLRDLTVDSNRETGVDNPLRQLLVATHSPYFVQLQERDDLLLATTVRVRGPFGRSASTLRCSPLLETWRGRLTNTGVGLGTILDYLTSPPGSQLQLELSAAVQ